MDSNVHYFKVNVRFHDNRDHNRQERGLPLVHSFKIFILAGMITSTNNLTNKENKKHPVKIEQLLIIIKSTANILAKQASRTNQSTKLLKCLLNCFCRCVPGSGSEVQVLSTYVMQSLWYICMIGVIVKFGSLVICIHNINGNICIDCVPDRVSWTSILKKETNPAFNLEKRRKGRVGFVKTLD